jgi:Icc protein
MSNPESGDIHIIQLSDLHLTSIQGGGLGWCYDSSHFDTTKSLQSVIQTVNRYEDHVDEYLISGDIAQAPTHRTYKRCLNLLKPLIRPVYCLPGNHDDPELLQQHLNHGNISTVRQHRSANWTIIQMNSVLPQLDHGYVSAQELSQVIDIIQNNEDRHILVAIHHHPVSVGSPWLDKIGIRNGNWLLQNLAQFKQVRGLVFGHIHQEFDSHYQHIRLLGTPSTCVQFKPDCPEFEYDQRAPAYRSIRLLHDGKIHSVVRYLPEITLDKSA